LPDCASAFNPDDINTAIIVIAKIQDFTALMTNPFLSHVYVDWQENIRYFAMYAKKRALQAINQSVWMGILKLLK
jgi:hypothetical protein